MRLNLFFIIFIVLTINGYSQANFQSPVVNPNGLTSIGIFSNASFADLDNDGDLDLLSGGRSPNFYYFENTGTNLEPAYAAVQNNPFGLTNISNDSFPTFVDLDGDGDMDILSGTGLGEYFYFQNTGTNSAPQYAAPIKNPFGLTDTGFSSYPTFGDLDNDGDLDLLSGGDPGSAGNDNFNYFENIGSVNSPQFAVVITNPFNLTQVGPSTRVNLGDLDGDGDLDIITGEQTNQFRYFENVGSTSAPSYAASQINPFGFTGMSSFSAPTFIDIDNDGDLDVMSGGSSGNFRFYKNQTGSTFVPDDVFEQYLIDQGYDTVLDDYVSTANIVNVTGVNLTGTNVSDLAGIQDFTALTNLELQNTPLLTSLNISSNTALGFLAIDNSQITTLDLSNNPNLYRLQASSIQLTSLNISSNPALDYLNLNNTPVGNIDFSNNPLLKTLSLFNTSTTSIDVSNNSALENLTVGNNSITTIDVSNNTSLTSLDARQTQISNIDVSGLVSLTNLQLESTQLESLDVSKNVLLQYLDFSKTQIGEIDVTKNIDLKGLIANNCKLTEIDLFSNIQLDALDLSFNEIINIDINKNKKLSYLRLNNNKFKRPYLANGTNTLITDFDIRNNPDLTCISVDDVNFSNTNWTDKDTSASYNLDCNSVWTVYTTDIQFEISLINAPSVDNNNDGEVTYEEAQNFTGDLNLNNKNIEEIIGLEAFTNANNINLSNNIIKDISSFLNSDSYLVQERSSGTTAVARRPKIRIKKFNVSNNLLSRVDISGTTGIEELYVNGNQLVSLNLKLGSSRGTSNTDLKIMDARNNPNLTCITVDNVSAAMNKSNWQKDNTASYNTNCEQSLSIDDDFLKTNISIYPNPTKSFIEVYLTNGLQLKSVTVYNLLGKRIQHSKNKRVDLLTLPIGVYFVKVITDKGIMSAKIIKE